MFDIPILLGTTSKFQFLKFKSEIQKNIKFKVTEKIPSVAGRLFKDLVFFDVLEL